MHLVTGAAAQLDAHTAETLGITVVDYPFQVNGEARPISHALTPAQRAELRQVLLHRRNVVGTSGLRETDLLAAYRAAPSSPILSMHQCVNFTTATYAALGKVQRDHPELSIEVLDTAHTLAGHTVQVLQVARALQDGADLDAVRALAARIRKTTVHVGVVKDLFYLNRTGRIGLARALLGTAMRAIPLLIVRDETGVAKPYGRVRSWTQANQRMVGTVEDDMERYGGKRLDVFVSHLGDHRDEVDHLVGLLEAKGWPMHVDRGEGNHCAAAHLGPDYWELGYTVHAD